jgi:hypothetical protein
MRAVLAALVLLGCAGPQRTLATPEAVPWVPSCYMHELDTVRAAFGYWNSIDTGVEFYELPCTASPDRGVGVFSDPFGDSAKVAVAYSIDTPRPAIAIHSPWNWLTPAQRETTIRHEIGHVMGLPNDYRNSECLMFRSINPAIQHPRPLCESELRQVRR